MLQPVMNVILAIGGMDFNVLIVKMDVNNVQAARCVRFVIKVIMLHRAYVLVVMKI